MSDIFISYASEDKNRVKSLAHALERKGWSVWWDRRIPAGKSFDEVIHEALRAAKSVVVVWSHTSVKSTWVKNESRSGLRRHILFPVMLLDEVEIPLEFEHLQAAHLMDWHPEQEHPGFDQFLDDLAGVIGAPPLAGVQPAPVQQGQEPPPSPILTPYTQAISSLVESNPSISTARAMPPSVSVEFPSSQGAEGLKVEQPSVRIDADRPSEPTGLAPSRQPFPIFPIGIGLLAAIGALVYFVIFSQGPSPETKDVVQSQPAVQPPAPEVRQPSAAVTQEKPAVKKEVTAGRTVATKPRPIAGPAKTITGKDGAPMVLVPAGEFWMGSPEGEGGADEHPRHRVYLDAFSIDQFEVTTAQYATFFQETKRPAPQYWSERVLNQYGRKPVVGVGWNDATAYCTWARKRLPTEAEWEKAARGTDERQYPWGNDAPTSKLTNFRKDYSGNPYEELAPVDSYETGMSPYGLYHMAGNVWEWVADRYDENYYSKSQERNPTGPSSGEYRVVRGGSWLNGLVAGQSADRYKDAPTTRFLTFGFRCAQDILK